MEKANLKNEAMLLVKTFLIHNSKTKIFPDNFGKMLVKTTNIFRGLSQ